MSGKISVIVATYRRDFELERALGSLNGQTFRDFEIVLVDDNDFKGWNEKVDAIVSDFKKSSSIPIKVITNSPNLGSARARNKGIEEAEGEYITFLDDDDMYLPFKLEKQYKKIKENDADFSITDFCLLNEDNEIVENRKRYYINDYDKLMTYHLKYHMTGTDTMMFKKDYLTKIGGFDPIDLGDEFYLMYKAIRGGGKFTYVEDNSVQAYVHTGETGLSSGQSKIECENSIYSFKKGFFYSLKRKDVRYIRMRHYAVLAYAYHRMRLPFKAVYNSGVSFCSAPFAFIKLFVNRK